MRILIYGAGIIGTIYAAYLKRAGHDLTILSSPTHKDLSRAGSLVLEGLNDKSQFQVEVNKIDSLKTDDPYDWVIVSVRQDQIASVIEPLSQSKATPNILFFGNNVRGAETLIRALRPERVALGFPGAGGDRKNGTVRYLLIPEQKTTLGELDGTKSRRLLGLAKTLRQAGFQVAISPKMESWLKTHALFVTMIAAAVYQAQGSAKQLSAREDILKEMVKATREGFRRLKALGINEKPFNLYLLYEIMPTFFAVNYWKKQFNSPLGEFSLAAHSITAKREIECLALDIRNIIKKAGQSAPLTEAFFSAAGI